jgi:hypothetical protein
MLGFGAGSPPRCFQQIVDSKGLGAIRGRIVVRLLLNVGVCASPTCIRCHFESCTCEAAIKSGAGTRVQTLRARVQAPENSLSPSRNSAGRERYLVHQITRPTTNVHDLRPAHAFDGAHAGNQIISSLRNSTLLPHAGVLPDVRVKCGTGAFQPGRRPIQCFITTRGTHLSGRSRLSVEVVSSPRQKLHLRSCNYSVGAPFLRTPYPGLLGEARSKQSDCHQSDDWAAQIL